MKFIEQVSKEIDESLTLQLTKKVRTKFIIKCTGSKERLHIYRNGFYDEEDAEQKIKGYLEALEPNISSKQVGEVLLKLRRLTYVNEKEFDSNPFMINFENKWYNWLEDKTYSHSPELLSRKQLPYPYPDKKVAPKYFGKFMRDIHYPSEIRTATEWMSYTFLRENKFELTCFKIGYGSNGKTTEDNLLRKLHGGRSVNGNMIGGSTTGFSLKQIMESRWATHRMRNANLNIDAETDGRPVDMTELKRLTSRDTQHEVESKGIDFQPVILYVKFQMNFNKDPVIINQSDGDIRRLVMLSYARQFEGKNDDKTLPEKLGQKEELSAIFACVIAPTLRRLHEAKSIYMADNTIEKRRLRYELISDPLKAATQAIFLSDATSDDYSSKRSTYEAYVVFCERNNLAKLTDRRFGYYLAKTLGLLDGRRGPRGQQVECWTGVRLNPAYTLDGSQKQLTDAG
jgi:phage/plasmid-associated DNA primase